MEWVCVAADGSTLGSDERWMVMGRGGSCDGFVGGGFGKGFGEVVQRFLSLPATVSSLVVYLVVLLRRYARAYCFCYGELGITGVTTVLCSVLLSLL